MFRLIAFLTANLKPLAVFALLMGLAVWARWRRAGTARPAPSTSSGSPAVSNPSPSQEPAVPKKPSR